MTTDKTKTHHFSLSLGEFTERYAVIETTAPKSYDYSYCIPIMGDERRWVLIPESKVSDQTSRYLSGLYSFEPADMPVNLTSYIAETLLKRLKD